jgi:hypothetical protein
MFQCIYYTVSDKIKKEQAGVDKERGRGLFKDTIWTFPWRDERELKNINHDNH